MFAAAAGHVGGRPGRCFCVPRSPFFVIPASERESSKRGFLCLFLRLLPRLLPPAHRFWFRLCANWAAVRHFVRASPPVIPGLTRNPGWLYAWYCVASLSSPANAPQGLVSEHGVTAVLRRLCCSAAIAAFATTCASLLVSLVRQLGCCSAIGANPPLLVIPGLTRNPGWLYARYCVALLPRWCPSPPTPPRVPHQVRDDGALRRCTIAPICTAAFFYSRHSGLDPESWVALCAVLRCAIASLVSIPPNASQGPRVRARGDGALRRCASALPLHSRPHSHHVIPASERESWVALCVVLRCAIASPVSILAFASQGPASSAG